MFEKLLIANGHSRVYSCRAVEIYFSFYVPFLCSCEYDFMLIGIPSEEDPKSATDWIIRCGDWDNKIKLMRYISKSSKLHMKFVSDFSHAFSGFRFELRLSAGTFKNNSCIII